MHQGLVEGNVASQKIKIIPDEQLATQTALESAEQGDLVLVLGDDVTRCWKQIIYFESGPKTKKAAKAAPVHISPEDFSGFELDDNVELIRDERGVRIAKEASD